MSAKLLYMDSSATEGEGTVTSINELEDGRRSVLLSETLFYPQGGGQPYDTGTINDFQVQETRFIEGDVHHIGEGTLEPDTVATLTVNKERRTMNSRVHTAGHLVDVAMFELGLKFDPGKGYHFPDSPYVEYLGMIEPEERENVKAELNRLMNDLIAKDLPVTHRLAELDELREVCMWVPDYVPTDKPSRVVFIGDYPGCPCGGTHVRSLAELGATEIHKIKGKGGNVRISYRVV